MKTTLFLSIMLIGGSLAFTNLKRPTGGVKLPAYKTSKAQRAASAPVSPVRIVIDKSDYELHVYDAKGWFATYPVVFGVNPLEDKKMEGDRRTPEGTYRITGKRPHSKWSHFIALDYPTKEDLAKFNQRKQRGEIPRNASPGGGIGIHGTWPRDEFMIDRYKNWTNGCIALKNEDVRDLYSYIQAGTPVTIRK